jgi:hypothetical protein
MPIIIDTNTISKVFNEQNGEHDKFRPVYQWIENGNGKFVYGGSKYRSELEKMESYMKLFKLYKDKRKAIEIDKDKVDERERLIKEEKLNGNFNDQHLVAIVIVSRCKLICTCDLKAIPFIRDPNLYPNGCARPKFYTGPQNHKLLR